MSFAILPFFIYSLLSWETTNTTSLVTPSTPEGLLRGIVSGLGGPLTSIINLLPNPATELPLRRPFLLFPHLLGSCIDCFLRPDAGERGASFFIPRWYGEDTIQPATCLYPRDFPITEKEHPFHFVCPVPHSKWEQIANDCFNGFYFFRHNISLLNCDTEVARLTPHRMTVAHERWVAAIRNVTE